MRGSRAAVGATASGDRAVDRLARDDQAHVRVDGARRNAASSSGDALVRAHLAEAEEDALAGREAEPRGAPSSRSTSCG